MTYSQIISKHPVLDKHESRALLLRFCAVRQYLIDPEEGIITDKSKQAAFTKFKDDAKMLHAMRSGLKAKEKIILHNLRLIEKEANRLTYNKDMVRSFGLMGLSKALDRYDITKGFAFSTYAVWIIKQLISKGIVKEERTIKIPSHVLEQLNVYRKHAEIIRKQEGNDVVTREKIARSILGDDITPEKLKTTLEKLDSLLDLTREAKSIYFTDSEGNDYSDRIADPKSDYTMELSDEQEERLRAVLNLFDSKDVKIISDVYGLKWQPMPVNEAANVHGVTIEYIDQLLVNVQSYVISPLFTWTITRN